MQKLIKGANVNPSQFGWVLVKGGMDVCVNVDAFMMICD
jgi:hypothetical protein